ncbi:hypothetical protein PIB30_090189 [Stylosanthes scabra]|uniref:Plastocyanin-like domain-containing protein n=1 Tax=Stylosanthes scabra TaxID=79078 RepID=A0ABU6SWM0_9FABA|nr:hypothetical protein [Stylosanthes scabra]
MLSVWRTQDAYNYLREPFLISWNGYKIEGTHSRMELKAQTVQFHQGRTTLMQLKSQIESCFYFPSLQMQKAAEGFGAIGIWNRLGLPFSFHPPAQDCTILARDWYKRGYHVRKTKPELSILNDRSQNN